MTRDIASIEKVLNSRCSSGFKTGPEKNGHWGTFINHPPQKKVINRLLLCCNIPRFSNGKLLHWFKNGYLFLGFETPKDPHTERMLHIESGMQQEAVHLACTAQGIGTCIRNQGINGTRYGEKIATARHLIMEMTNPYESGKFTTKTPGPEKPSRTSRNLSEPSRDSDVECLPQLERLASFNKSGSSATKKDISQLLWAAKGRTPHHVKSHPWGLTIPTWGGGQNHTNVYFVKENKLFRYINWTMDSFPFWRISSRAQRAFWWAVGNPTHDTRFLKKVSVSSQLDGANSAIILTRNEKTNRALWEVGYMLENMFLQAKSLNIPYTSKIFDNDKIKQMAKAGVSEAVAAVLL